MFDDKIPDTMKIVKSLQDGVWVSPVLENGELSTEQIFIPDNNANVTKKDYVLMYKSTWAEARDLLSASKILKTRSLPIPSAILASLSVELFLKSLILSKGCKKFSHNIKDLYGKLDSSIKNGILDEMLNVTTEKDFIKMLDSDSMTFEKLRYLYEYENVPFNLDFLIGFSDILYSFCITELNIEL